MSEEQDTPADKDAPEESPGAVGGQRLRDARRAQQISVLEVAKELHLDEAKVRALESNEFDKLGAPVFAKGHLRKYAQLVGVNADDVFADYYQMTRAVPVPPVVIGRKKVRREMSPGPWIALIIVSEPQWQRLAELIGRPELADDPGYASGALRHEHEAAINEMISAWTRTRTKDEAYMTLRENKIPVAPVRDVAEVMNDAHMHERGMLHRMSHPYIGDIVLPSSPIRLSEFPPVPLEFFHEPGADNAEVLADWIGMGADEVAALAKEGVV